MGAKCSSFFHFRSHKHRSVYSAAITHFAYFDIILLPLSVCFHATGLQYSIFKIQDSRFKPTLLPHPRNYTRDILNIHRNNIKQTPQIVLQNQLKYTTYMREGERWKAHKIYLLHITVPPLFDDVHRSPRAWGVSGISTSLILLSKGEFVTFNVCVSLCCAHEGEACFYGSVRMLIRKNEKLSFAPSRPGVNPLSTYLSSALAKELPF